MPITVKLVVIGASGVGKTSLRGKYVNGRFSSGYRATIGADFITKVLENPIHPNGDPVTLQIWDTAGQERFSSLSTAFFRGADACLLMYDVNAPETLTALTKWWQEFCDRAPVADEDLQDFCVVVVGNKTDLADSNITKGKSVVSKQDAENFLDEIVPPLTPSPITPHSPMNLVHESLHEEEDQSSSSASTYKPSISPSQNGVAFPSSSPPRSASIAIQQRPSFRQSAVSLSPGTKTRNSRSRSSTRFNSGTMTTMHSGLSIYHTPSSSMFSDSYLSARSSPEPGWSRPSSPGGGNSSPSRSRVGRRTSTLSNASLTTLTPSLFARQRQEQDTELASAAMRPPDRGPRLFLASAKTGDGVTDIFEYIAERALRKMEWEERRMQFSDDGRGSTSLRLGSTGYGHMDQRRGNSTCCS